jgi:hypothetical protein
MKIRTYLCKDGKFLAYFSGTGSDVVGGLLLSHVGLPVRRGPLKGPFENMSIFSRSNRSTEVLLVGNESGMVKQSTERI